ncbi:MAG: GTP-binding protein [Planctomycetes bacterium]|nr:GTP-binding protein [Planctomycetota bacterium]
MKRIPLVIVTGYLGAGKTTLVRRLLPAFEAKSLKGLLIVNEVGDVNVDGASLGDAALEQRELLGGCACCSLRGDLYNALLEGVENYQPDYILLETSGLAEPSELLDAATAPKLRAFLEVTDIITLVDAANFARQVRSGRLAQMQATFASVLVVNKQDQASESEVKATLDALQELNPSALVFVAAQAELPAKQALARTFAFLDGKPFDALALGPGTVGNGEEPHHHHHHAHAGFFALNIDLPEEITEDALRHALKELTPKAYRVKGFARVIGHQKPWIFQRVGDLPAQTTAFVLEGVNVPIGMVLIGSGLCEADVASTLELLRAKVRRISA